VHFLQIHLQADELLRNSLRSMISLRGSLLGKRRSDRSFPGIEISCFSSLPHSSSKLPALFLSISQTMAFSVVGKTKVAVHAILFLVNIFVLALSARVNNYQEFFYVADLFPLALSIITLVLLTTMLALDFATTASYTGRPQFEIGAFGVMSIFWLAFNAFSTSRWRHVPMACGSIPSDYSDAQQWCQEVQALKGLVWVEWVIFFLTTLATLRYAMTQYSRGNKHVFKMPLSRYSPSLRSDYNVSYARDSEFLQYGRMGEKSL